MRRDLISSIRPVAVFTARLGLVSPLVMTGVGQLVFPGAANGSRLERDGKLVGSSLIGQDCKGDPRYFQSRPSATGYDPAGTFFDNLGPNSAELRDMFAKNLEAYLALEGPDNPGLTPAAVPADAVQTSASGVDPHISPANEAIQAHRVARVRGLELARVDALVKDNTDGRSLGVLGEPGVNVLKLNLALDREPAR